MRITAGIFKGREIFSYKDKEGQLRPTSSKTREAVFNLLKHGKFLGQVDFLDEENPSILEGRTIADIFCGTGIMAFEASSRGAKKLILVDKNSLTLELCKKTANKLNIFNNCTFLRTNATELPSPPEKCDVIFLDPPYNKGFLTPTLASIAKNRWPRDGGIVIVEHSIKEDLVVEAPYELLDRREYNNTYISILKIKY